jgi:hypothetical protein
MSYSAPTLTIDTEGSHNFERGGMVIGDDHHGDWTHHPRDL